MIETEHEDPTAVVWPTCRDTRRIERPGEGSITYLCDLKRGHPGLHVSIDPWDQQWGDVRQYQEQMAIQQMQTNQKVVSLRDKVANMFTNYVGQEGRGASVLTRNEVLKRIDETWPSLAPSGTTSTDS